jgi:peptide/nickel transport system substrate-binding protein
LRVDRYLDGMQTASTIGRRGFLARALGGLGAAVSTTGLWSQIAAGQEREPRGQMTWAIQANISPSWFDPAETPGIATPYIFLYALHDALVKPMPGRAMAASLASSWSESDDGLTYDFVLRQGLTFHNGDRFTAEDVKFSYERYTGTGAGELRQKIKAVTVMTPHLVRFTLYEPWSDFLTYYATPATGAGWIVPKNYTEKVGSEKFREQPIGLGPYRLLHFRPGVEVILEANTSYWRKTPSVKRLVLKSVPDATMRLTMLKRREADVAYALFGPLGEEARRDPSLKLEAVVSPATQWVVFTSRQYDRASPWFDRRVRLAANHAINRQAINEAETLGHSVPTGNIVPRRFDGALALEPYPYDPKKARQLLTEAGYARGFDAGHFAIDNVFTGLGEAIVNDLAAVGIRTKMRPLDRAADQAAHHDRTHNGLALQTSAALGSAATRIGTFIASTGAQSWIKDPQIDTWHAEQATERNRQHRHAILHRIQQKLYDEVRFIPIWELGVLHASGPRVAVSGLGLIPLLLFSGPLEDVQLKS